MERYAEEHYRPPNKPGIHGQTGQEQSRHQGFVNFARAKGSSGPAFENSGPTRRPESLCNARSSTRADSKEHTNGSERGQARRSQSTPQAAARCSTHAPSPLLSKQWPVTTVRRPPRAMRSSQSMPAPRTEGSFHHLLGLPVLCRLELPSPSPATIRKLRSKVSDVLFLPEASVNHLGLSGMPPASVPMFRLLSIRRHESARVPCATVRLLRVGFSPARKHLKRDTFCRGGRRSH